MRSRLKAIPRTNRSNCVCRARPRDAVIIRPLSGDARTLTRSATPIVKFLRPGGRWAGGHWAAGDLLPVANVDLVRSVGLVEAAEVGAVFVEPPQLLFGREFTGMRRTGRAAPDDPRATLGQQFEHDVVP